MRDGVPANRACATLKPNDLALKAIIARTCSPNRNFGVVAYVNRMPKSATEPCIPTREAKVPAGGRTGSTKIKHDGYRLIVQRDGKRVRLFTRDGHDWSGRFPLITETLRNRNSSNGGPISHGWCARSSLLAEGGTCAMRAVTGQKAPALLGVRSHLVFGAMLYRAGPDEMADVIAFCGPNNRARQLDGQVLGHYWLEAGADLIDFTENPQTLGSRNLDRDRHPADDDGCASDAGGLTCRTPYGSLAGVSAPCRLDYADEKAAATHLRRARRAGSLVCGRSVRSHIRSPRAAR